MSFREEHHAFLIACFYRELAARGEPGLALFRKGAQAYGEQRGRRMALRALRDGHTPDFTAYFAYGEWAAGEGASASTVQALDGVVDQCVTRCPWAKTFAEEGLLECGECYCREIDRAIVRGFNPDLRIDVERTMHRGGSCRFYFRDSGVSPDTLEQARALPKSGRTVMGFDYHCGHLYAAFCDIIEDVLEPDAAAKLTGGVREAFAQRYGQEMAATLDEHRAVNFLRLPE